MSESKEMIFDMTEDMKNDALVQVWLILFEFLTIFLKIFYFFQCNISKFQKKRPRPRLSFKKSRARFLNL